MGHARPLLPADPRPSSGTRWGRPGRRFASALALALAAVVAAFVLWRLDRSTLSSLGTTHAWALLGVAALAHLLTLPLKALAWRSALAAALPPGRGLPLGIVISPVAIGALLNVVLVGRIGEAARVLLVHGRLSRGDRPAEMSVVVGSAVTESLVSTAAWVAFVAAVGAVFGLSGAVWLALAVLTALWALVLVAAARGWWSGATATAPTTLVGRLLAACRRVWVAVARGHRALRSPSVLASLAGFGLAGWLVQWVSVYALLAAFDIGGGWMAAALVLIAVSLSQTLPVLPGNVGVFQAAAAVPLVASYGVSPATALALGVVLQLVQTVPIALLGAAALVREGESLRHIRASARRLTARAEGAAL